MMPQVEDSTRKRLYDRLASEGYQLPEFGRFDLGLNDPAKRKLLFDRLSTEGFQLPNFSLFDTRLAPKQPPPAPKVGAEIGAPSYVTPEGIPVAEFAPSPEGGMARVFQLPGVTATAKQQPIYTQEQLDAAKKLIAETNAQRLQQRIAAGVQTPPPSITTPTTESELAYEGYRKQMEDFLGYAPPQVATLPEALKVIHEQGTKETLRQQAPLYAEALKKAPFIGSIFGGIETAAAAAKEKDPLSAAITFALGNSQAAVGVMMAHAAASPLIQTFQLSEQTEADLSKPVREFATKYAEWEATRSGAFDERQIQKLGELGGFVGEMGMWVLLAEAPNLALKVRSGKASPQEVKQAQDVIRNTTPERAKEIISKRSPEEVQKIEALANRFEQVRPSGEQGPPQEIKATPEVKPLSAQERYALELMSPQERLDFLAGKAKEKPEPGIIQAKPPEEKGLIKPVEVAGRREVPEVREERVTPLQKPIPAIEEQPPPPLPKTTLVQVKRDSPGVHRLYYRGTDNPVEQFQDRTFKTPNEARTFYNQQISAKQPVAPVAKENLENRRVIEGEGLRYDGEASGYTWFTDPKTKSTLVLKPEEVTPENVRTHIEESRAKFETPKAAEVAKPPDELDIMARQAGISEKEIQDFHERDKVLGEEVTQDALKYLRTNPTEAREVIRRREGPEALARYEEMLKAEPPPPVKPEGGQKVSEMTKVVLNDRLNEMLKRPTESLNQRERLNREMGELQTAYFEAKTGLKIGQEVELRNGKRGILEGGRIDVEGYPDIVTVDNAVLPFSQIAKPPAPEGVKAEGEKGRIIESGGATKLYPSYEAYQKDVVALGYSLEDLKSAGMPTTEKGFIAHREKQIRDYVEKPAQPIVRKILDEGGEPYWSNAYGPQEKGVKYIDAEGKDRFEPLVSPPSVKAEGEKREPLKVIDTYKIGMSGTRRRLSNGWFIDSGSPGQRGKYELYEPGGTAPQGLNRHPIAALRGRADTMKEVMAMAEEAIQKPLAETQKPSPPSVPVGKEQLAERRAKTEEHLRRVAESKKVPSPYEMTQLEYWREGINKRGTDRGSSDYDHKLAVETALEEGRPVPESVLKDYPDLIQKYGKKEEPPVAKAVAGVPGRAQAFRRLADMLQSQIDNLRREMTQNPTPKRMAQYRTRMIEADDVERGQKALLALADAHERGDVPAILRDLKAKSEVLPLVRKGLSGGGGYYDRIASMEYRDTSPKAKALQELLEAKPEGRAVETEKQKAQKLAQLEAEVQFSKLPGFFPTPKPLIDKMLDAAEIKATDAVLEPSAGKGDILDAIKQRHPEVTDLEAVESMHPLRNILEAKGYELGGADFLEYKTPADKIVMNPPFERGQDIDHVRHAYDLLNPGGRLVSIMSEGTFSRGDKKATAFREWLEEVDGTSEKVAEGGFKEKGTFRPTGVASRMVVIDKPQAAVRTGTGGKPLFLQGIAGLSYLSIDSIPGLSDEEKDRLKTILGPVTIMAIAGPALAKLSPKALGALKEIQSSISKKGLVLGEAVKEISSQVGDYLKSEGKDLPEAERVVIGKIADPVELARAVVKEEAIAKQELPRTQEAQQNRQQSKQLGIIDPKPIAGGRSLPDQARDIPPPGIDIFTDTFRTLTESNIQTAGEYVKKQPGGGALLVRDINRESRESAQWAGRLERDWRIASKGLNDLEWAEFVRVADEGGLPKNPKVQTALDSWNKIRREIAKAAVDQEFEMVAYDKARQDFVKVPFKPRENFFPHEFDMTEMRKAENREKFITQFAEKLNLPMSEAEFVFNKWIRSRIEAKYGHLEHARDFDVEGWKKTRAVIPEYIERATRRLTQAKVYGKDYAIAQNWVEQILQNGGDYKAAQQLFDRVIGRDRSDDVFSRFLLATTKHVNSWQVATKLTLLSLLNWTQLNNAGLVSGWRSLAKTVLRAIPDRAKNQEFGDRMGGILESTIKMHQKEELSMQGIGSKMLKITGVNREERILRTLSSVAAADYFKRQGENIAANPKKVTLRGVLQRKLAYLNLDMDIDLKDVVKRGGFSEKQLLDIGYETARKTQFLTRPQDVQFLIGDPRYKMFTQFKSFIIQQTKLLNDAVIKEARHGNLAPLAYLISMYPIAGEMAQDIRSFVTGRSRPDDPIERIIEDFATVGALGIIYDMFRQASRDPAGLISWMAGPTANDLSKLGYGITEAVQGNPVPLGRVAVGQLPVPLVQQWLMESLRRKPEKKTATLKR